MAAFPAREWGPFVAHAARIHVDPTVTNRTIVVDGQVAGSIVCWLEESGERDVGYWLGREFWGRGLATRALSAFLELVPHRPLHARVAKHNAGSLRVLEKCGFAIVGDDRLPSGIGPDDVEEWILRLDAGAADVPAVATFRALHASGCFVLPNPWDIGSAVYLERLGFKALATTSSGFAFSRGLPDTVSAMPRDAMLDHVREIVRATALPVNSDYLSGYADDPDKLAINVTACVETGAAGLSIEDSTGDPARRLYDRDLAIERVRAARAAIDATGTGVILTARCEAWLVGDPDPMRTALDRLVAFADAGADCLYAPGVRDPAEIAAIVRAVAPRPVNVLMSAPVPGLSVGALAGLGVRRISLGSALARAAWGGFIRAARGIAETGSFDQLAGAAPFGELDDLFRSRGS